MVMTVKYDLTQTDLMEDLIYYRGTGYSQEEISDILEIPQATVSRKMKELSELERQNKITVSIGVEKNE